MTDRNALDTAIKDSGVTITFIAEKMGCSRNRVYAIIKGADCTASEIVLISSILHLTKEQRDSIFFAPESELHSRSAPDEFSFVKP